MKYAVEEQMQQTKNVSHFYPIVVILTKGGVNLRKGIRLWPEVLLIIIISDLKECPIYIVTRSV